MALSLYRIHRWWLMLTGKSIWHVNQNIGSEFEIDKIRGYYNDLTEKVTKMPELLESNELPKLSYDSGKFTYFPVAIFQYGLGAYDLYLKTSDNKYEKKFLQSVEWAFEHQDELGRWNNFSHYSPEAPYGAMAQGEGASLLIRGYKYTGIERYLDAARKAIDFMLLPLQEGGTAKYEGNDIFLMEYTTKKMVLNGSIFAWWGLYDYVVVTGDHGKYYNARNNTLETLTKVLPNFKCWCWSMYSLDGLIASPFYHNLHIAQMQAMNKLTGVPIFNDYAKQWRRQQRNPFNKTVAIVKKAVQKVLE